VSAAREKEATMSKLDRLFAEYRERAFRSPLTRAQRVVLPGLELPGGVAVALSLNR
jgi:hypothetical protein